MKLEKHIEDLIGLLKDIRKEPSPSVVGFAFSTAALHMFAIVFYDKLDPGRTVKHSDFRSQRGIDKLKNSIRDFDKKDELFDLWKEMENKRNELCYGYPDEKDIKEYSDRFYKIKKILEGLFATKLDTEALEDYLKNLRGDKNE